MFSIDKYQPDSIKDLVFADSHNATRVRQYAAGKRKGNILLYGPKGTGKSTTAKVICLELFKRVGHEDRPQFHRGINFTDKNFDTILNGFGWQMVGGVETPYEIIEEVDEMSKPMQRKLRGFLDEKPFGNVILTTNNPHLLDAPLMDRCDEIEMLVPSVEAVLPQATKILTGEGVACDDALIRKLLAAGDGSLRRMLRNVEDFVLRDR